MASHSPAAFDVKTYLATSGLNRNILKFRKGGVVFSQGAPADSVFYIQKGKFKVTVLSERGKEAVVSILGPGDFFGEACLAIAQKARQVSVSALTDAAVMQIDKNTMTQMLHKETTFLEVFMAHILNHSIRVEADLVDQLFNSSERRLARLLLLLANYGNEGKPEPLLAKISQQTLAEMIGTTRSRVSFFMNKFRKLGFIDYNGHIEVHSSLLNLVLHEQPHIKARE